MPEVASAFAALYENKDGIMDKMMDFWKVVAQRFSSNQYVIGYDILNEPWIANIYHEPSLMWPGRFDRNKLFPLDVQAHEAVREVDDDKVIFFEPT